MANVIAVLADRSERVQLHQALARRHQLTICGDLSAIGRCGSCDETVIVLDLAWWSIAAWKDLLVASPGLRGSRLILRGDLHDATARRVVTCAASLATTRISIRQRDQLAADVGAAVDSPRVYRTPPTLAVVAGLRLSSLDVVDKIVVGGIIVGRTRITVKQLADLLCMPQRTLEWRLHQSRLPTARTLLAWSAAIHAVWYLEVLNWPMKRVATTQGFPSSDSLGNYLQHHMGERPTTLQRQFGFDALIQRFVARWTRLPVFGAARPSRGGYDADTDVTTIGD